MDKLCPHGYSIGFVLQGGCPCCALVIQRPERMFAMLKKIEWIDNGLGFAETGGRGTLFCPYCSGERPNHRVRCELGALIAELERPS